MGLPEHQDRDESLPLQLVKLGEGVVKYLENDRDKIEITIY